MGSEMCIRDSPKAVGPVPYDQAGSLATAALFFCLRLCSRPERKGGRRHDSCIPLPTDITRDQSIVTRAITVRAITVCETAGQARSPEGQQKGRSGDRSAGPLYGVLEEKMAVRVGFEPTIEFPLYPRSRRAP